jgi:hypothetical protein
VLGATEFEYRRWKKCHRGGSFLPAAEAADLIEIAVGVSPATFALGKKMREMDRQRDQASPAVAARLPHLTATTEHADLESACDRQDRLDLELRAPDGSLIPTEWISIRDTEFLLSVSEDDDSELECDDWSEDEWEVSDAEIGSLDEDDMFDEIEGWVDEYESEWNEGPEKPFPRYQILVSLLADEDVP